MLVGLNKTVCPSGLRGWTQVPLAKAAWVQIPQLSFSLPATESSPMRKCGPPDESEDPCGCNALQPATVGVSLAVQHGGNNFQTPACFSISSSGRPAASSAGTRRNGITPVLLQSGTAGPWPIVDHGSGNFQTRAAPSISAAVCLPHAAWGTWCSGITPA